MFSMCQICELVYIVFLEFKGQSSLEENDQNKKQCEYINCVAQSECCRALGKRESVWTGVVKGGLVVNACEVGRIWVH